jgi:hypothetical protein
MVASGEGSESEVCVERVAGVGSGSMMKNVDIDTSFQECIRGEECRRCLYVRV